MSKTGGKPGPFSIAAIGASAGGLAAFEDLLSAVPADPGIAIILVPHLSRGHKSHLAEILRRRAKLPVAEVKNGDRVAPNRIYVVPPNRVLRIKGGALRLSPYRRKADHLGPIDGFFRSLAEDQGKLAIGVVLSGEGADGTEGLRAIRAAGGTAFAQDGESAAHASMPRAAAAAGCVDRVLRPADIGRVLGASVTGIQRRRGTARPDARSGGEEFLDRVLDLLHTLKGVDFSYYKRSTLRRRVQRRMTVTRLREPRRYLAALRADPQEAGLLFGDILISVTSFFREPDTFVALKSTIYPRLLRTLAPGAPVRIWVPGCSTGEEAYSHAMNLVEYLGRRAPHVPFQIFATDVNPAVIALARAGRYTKKEVAGVSAERLRRFFVEENGGYRVTPALRERCVFATQNLVKDPPFTNLEMISCRNLLIYMGPALQEKAMQIFQFALKPRGILMLGRSETVGDFTGRFSSLSVKKKVFSERTPGVKGALDFVPPARFLETEPAAQPRTRSSVHAPEAFDLLGSLEGVLPARLVPNGVIVNGELEIVRFLGDTSPFLRPAAGKASMNLRRMAAGELLLALRAAVQTARKEGRPARKELAQALPGAAGRRVRVEVLPIARAAEYFLVLFEELAPAEGAPRPRRTGKDGRSVVELKEDLAVSGEHLKAIIEEQENTNAKLKSSNEELLSSNEELQSINEEFETTKEELQSSNEELMTSTEEVGRGNQVLTRANNDLSNLLANINIPVVLLDQNLTVHRVTPAAERLLGLSADKLGRSIVDLRLPLRLPDLKELLLGVIKSGQVLTREVQDGDGRWHYLILRPYRTDKSRTEKSRTEGAVLALVDIHDRKLAEKTVLRLATLVLDSNDAVIICDLKDRVIAWNKGAQKMYGYAEAEALGMSIKRLMPTNKVVRAAELVRLAGQQGKKTAPIEIQRRTKDGRTLSVLLTVTVLRDDDGQPVEVATTERDITEKNLAERAYRLSEKTVQRLANSVLDSNDAVIICDLEGRILAWNKGAQKMYGYTEAAALGMSIKRLMPTGSVVSALELARLSPAPLETKRRTKDGRIIDVLRTVTVLRDENGQPLEIAKTERDITERKRIEGETKRSEGSARRLATLVLDSNDAVIICDLKDRISDWNKGAQRMYGWTEAEAIGMSIRRLMPENKLLRARELVRIAAQQGKKATPIETQRRTKLGRVLDVLVTVTVLRDGDGQPVEVAMTERDITMLKGADREFRRLHARVVSAQETERKRLARDLHDGVGQILSGVKFRLQALPGQMSLSGGAEAKIMKVGGFLDHAIAEIRRVSQNLMPAELVDLGLEPALSTLCREFKERSDIHVTVRTVPVSVEPNLGLAFFRIAQEALQNIAKHSKATMVSVALSLKGKHLVLSVSDNGVGFTIGSRPVLGKGIGLGNMRQRVESVGGSIELHSTPGAGTSLVVQAPLTGPGEYS